MLGVTPASTRTTAFLVVAVGVLAASTAAALAGSRAGGRISFASNREGDSEIYVMRTDGSGVTRPTRSPKVDSPCQWSRDGRKLLFYSQRSPNGDVWVMNADGTGQRNVTRNAAHDGCMNGGGWSPDGRQIVFDSNRNGAGALKLSPAFLAGAAVLLVSAGAQATPPGQNGKLAFRRLFNAQHTWGALFTANPDGTGLHQITRPKRFVADIEPDWSPDGRLVVFQRIDVNGCGAGCETDEVDAVSSDGARVIRLAYDPPGEGCIKHGQPAGGVCRAVPAWSPDGKRIAFQCQVQPSSSDPGYSRICVMNADGSHVRELPQEPATGLSDSAPSWSPDGRQLAFGRGVRDQQAVFVMSADGSNTRQVTPWALRAGQPDWSPDGRRLVFYSNRDGPTHVSANLFTVGADGTALKQLTHARGGRVQYLSASFSPDGRWIAFSRTPGVGASGNADVYLMRADGTGVRNVTRSTIWDSGVDWGPRRQHLKGES